MGTPDMEDRAPAAQAGAVIQHFYTSRAWIDGRAEDQLTHIAGWPGITRIAAFPDLHPGKYGPVGCAVLADRLYPQLIGNDIGCGMALFALDLPYRRFSHSKALRRIRALGAPLQTPQGARLEEIGLPADLFATALGTIGGGNHFCEVQTLQSPQAGCPLDAGLTYLLVHSGSRGLGTATLTSLPGSLGGGLDPDSAAAQSYIAAHDQAVRWAALNRQIIAERAAEALRADLRLITDVPHNILAQSPEGWLHHKGAAALSAVTGALVPVAGSRATPSYLVRGLHPPAALGALAHGAGRRYDRASMHGRVRGKRSDLAAMTRTALGGHIICEDRAMLIEEAPEAYKSADSVVADLEVTGVAQRCATLIPRLTFKKTRQEAM